MYDDDFLQYRIREEEFFRDKKRDLIQRCSDNSNSALYFLNLKDLGELMSITYDHEFGYVIFKIRLSDGRFLAAYILKCRLFAYLDMESIKKYYFRHGLCVRHFDFYKILDSNTDQKIHERGEKPLSRSRDHNRFYDDWER